MRTTINIDDPILRDLKKLQRAEGKSLGRLVSELLAQALGNRRRRPEEAIPAFRWFSQPMGARVDLSDREAILDTMDRDGR